MAIQSVMKITPFSEPQQLKYENKPANQIAAASKHEHDSVARAAAKKNTDQKLLTFCSLNNELPASGCASGFLHQSVLSVSFSLVIGLVIADSVMPSIVLTIEPRFLRADSTPQHTVRRRQSPLHLIFTVNSPKFQIE